MIIPLVKPIVKFIIDLFDSGGLGSKPTYRGPSGFFRVHPYLHNPLLVYRPSNLSIFKKIVKFKIWLFNLKYAIVGKPERGPLKSNIVHIFPPYNVRPSFHSIYYKWLDKKGYAVCDGVTENIGIIDYIITILPVLGLALFSTIIIKVIKFKWSKNEKEN